MLRMLNIKIPAAIEDDTVYDDISKAFESMGFTPGKQEQRNVIS